MHSAEVFKSDTPTEREETTFSGRLGKCFSKRAEELRREDLTYS